MSSELQSRALRGRLLIIFVVTLFGAGFIALWQVTNGEQPTPKTLITSSAVFAFMTWAYLGRKASPGLIRQIGLGMIDDLTLPLLAAAAMVPCMIAGVVVVGVPAGLIFGDTAGLIGVLIGMAAGTYYGFKLFVRLKEKSESRS